MLQRGMVRALTALLLATLAAGAASEGDSATWELTRGYDLCGSATLPPTLEAGLNRARDAAFDPRGSGTLWLASSAAASLRAVTLGGAPLREIPYDALVEGSGLAGEVSSMTWVEPSRLVLVVGGGVLVLDVDAEEPTAKALLSGSALSHIAYDRASGKLLAVETAGSVGALYDLGWDGTLTPVEQDALDIMGVDATLTSVLASQNVSGLHAHGDTLYTLCQSCMALIQSTVSGEVIATRSFGEGIPRLVDSAWELPPPPDAFTFTPNGEVLVVITGDSMFQYCQGGERADEASKQEWRTVPVRSRTPTGQRRSGRARSGRLPVAGNGVADSLFSWMPPELRPAISPSRSTQPNLSPIDPSRVITGIAPTPAPAGSTQLDIDQFFANQARTSFAYDISRYQPNPPPIVWPLEDWRPPSQPPP
mmetsp:Transcript_15117/g.39084  ORF Transcript_15117/g.39084 Transcript_15117/m.39084 type:complete len:422 (+) Transcript_15117:97-1362(+)